MFGQSGTNNVGNTIIDLNQPAPTSTRTSPPRSGPLNPTSNQVGFAATFISQGNNIIGTARSARQHGVHRAGDQTGVTQGQLNLGPLQNNGGPTPTDGLLSGSIAIDAGNPTASSNGAGLTTDQRGAGFPRIAGAHVDVGAFELQPPVITGFNPNPVLEGSRSALADHQRHRLRARRHGQLRRDRADARPASRRTRSS